MTGVQTCALPILSSSNGISEFQISKNVWLSLYNTSASKRFRSFLYEQIRMTDAIIYILNVNLSTDLEELQEIINGVNENCINISHFYLATSHSDLNWSFPREKVQSFADKNKLKLFITTLDDYDSIDKMFKQIVNDLIKSKSNNESVQFFSDIENENDTCLIQ